MSKSHSIERISALAELERLEWKWESAGGNEIRLKCPGHEDSSPSASMNTSTNLWKCHVPSCAAKGDIVSFVAMALQSTRYAVLVEMSSRYELSDEKTIDVQSIERFHSKLYEAGPLLNALYERGLTDEMLRTGRIGYHDGRITIPVTDQHGRVMNVLRYLPGAPGPRKMRNTRGHSAVRLYRITDLAMDKVWVCGGPMKALLVGEMLKTRGYGAVSSTGGEGYWNPEWNERFRNKAVWLCMDVDRAGTIAAKRIAGILSTVAASVKVIKLPLDLEKYPKGDVNDYVGGEGATADDLVRLTETASILEVDAAAQAVIVELGSKRVEFKDLMRPDNIGWRIEVDCAPNAMEDTPSFVPGTISVRCDRAQPGCPSCTVARCEPEASGVTIMDVPVASVHVISLSACKTDGQRRSMREALGIPRCKSVQMQPLSYRATREIRLSPQISVTSTGGSSQPAILVDCEVELSTPYIMRGRVYPHPSNQRACFLVDEAEAVLDSLAAFEATDDELESLKLFCPLQWSREAVEHKLDEVYSDLEINVTRIYGRRDLHMTMDVAYHSPILIDVAGREVPGWSCVLVVGDTAQGKSETAVRLMEHYGLGEKVDCKNATVAGLMGGVQQFGTKWFVSWGIIPMNDRGLVIMEELKGATVETISKLTEMRSSGVAMVPKIEKRRANARTRLLLISNPRSNRPMASYAFGVHALSELMGAPEDLRRVDLAIGVCRGAVSHEIMYSETKSEHRYTSELCRRLLLWTWSLGRGDVVTHTQAIIALKEERDALVGAYDDTLPLIDAGTIEQKLIRVAAALAARTFSRDDEGRLLIREAHVRIAADLMRRLYNSEALKYGEFSSLRRRMLTTAEPRIIIDWLKRQPNFDHLVQGLHECDLVTKDDVADHAGLDQEGARQVISFLVRTHCIRRVTQGGSYAKNQDFVSLLRKMHDGQIKVKPYQEDM